MPSLAQLFHQAVALPSEGSDAEAAGEGALVWIVWLLGRTGFACVPSPAPRGRLSRRERDVRLWIVLELVNCMAQYWFILGLSKRGAFVRWSGKQRCLAGDFPLAASRTVFPAHKKRRPGCKDRRCVFLSSEEPADEVSRTAS